MKVIVVSDSHGKFHRLEKIRQRHFDADYFIHCGDIETDRTYADGFAVVQGNNDRYFNYPGEMVLKFGEIRTLITHSHQYHHPQRVSQLQQKALKLGCQLVLYGHSHQFNYEIVNGVTLVNPGSLYYNRDGSPISYVELTIEGKEIIVKLIKFEE